MRRINCFFVRKHFNFIVSYYSMLAHHILIVSLLLVLTYVNCLWLLQVYLLLILTAPWPPYFLALGGHPLLGCDHLQTLCRYRNSKFICITEMLIWTIMYFSLSSQTSLAPDPTADQYEQLSFVLWYCKVFRSNFVILHFRFNVLPGLCLVLRC